MLSFASQILQIQGKPQDSPFENKISLFNEIMATCYLYTLITVTDFMGRNAVKEECGLILLGIVLFTISANILKVLIQVIIMAVEKVSKDLRKKK